MDKLFVNFLPPWVETNIQPAFYDKESGSVLQQTARMYAKVQQITRLFNEFSEDVSNEINNFENDTNTEIERFEGVVNATVKEYIDKFVALKDFVDDYFDNLDVQKEINNKLDQMVEDGVLQEIITTYIQSNVAWTFTSVANMKASTNLAKGSYAQTTGYYSNNDGGKALYYIRAKEEGETTDESFTIAIGDDLVAELVKGETVTVESLGVIDLDDATTKLQALIDYAIANDVILEFGNNNFNITAIDFKTAQLKFNNTTFTSISEDSSNVAITMTEPAKGAIYSNFTVDGNRAGGIKINTPRNLLLHHIEVKNCKTGIETSNGYECTIRDTLIMNEADIADSIGLLVGNDDSLFDGIVIQNFRTGVKNTTGAGDYYNNIHIWSSIIDTVLNSVGFELNANANIDKCVFDSCMIGIKVKSEKWIKVTNCRWIWGTWLISDQVLDGRTIYEFYFDQATYSWNTYVKDCFGSIPSTVSTQNLLFSNIAVADWKSPCSVKYESPLLTAGKNIPTGIHSSLGNTDTTKLTPISNIVDITSTSVTVAFTGTCIAEGSCKVGTLSKSRLALPENTINYTCVYGGEWAAPEGFGYLYINKSTGDIMTSINASMLNKVLKIYITFPR